MVSHANSLGAFSTFCNAVVSKQVLLSCLASTSVIVSRLLDSAIGSNLEVLNLGPGSCSALEKAPRRWFVCLCLSTSVTIRLCHRYLPMAPFAVGWRISQSFFTFLLHWDRVDKPKVRASAIVQSCVLLSDIGVSLRRKWGGHSTCVKVLQIRYFGKGFKAYLVFFRTVFLT